MEAVDRIAVENLAHDRVGEIRILVAAERTGRVVIVALHEGALGVAPEPFGVVAPHVRARLGEIHARDDPQVLLAAGGRDLADQVAVADHLAHVVVFHGARVERIDAAHADDDRLRLRGLAIRHEPLHVERGELEFARVGMIDAQRPLMPQARRGALRDRVPGRAAPRRGCRGGGLQEFASIHGRPLRLSRPSLQRCAGAVWTRVGERHCGLPLRASADPGGMLSSARFWSASEVSDGPERYRGG
jgi:hypothetical protein